MLRKILFLVMFFMLVVGPAMAAVDLVWPPPPDKARIQLTRVITNPADIGIKKSFFKKLWDFLAGEEEEELVRPFGLAVKNGRLFVTDTGGQSLHILDFKEGKYILASNKKIQMLAPVGIAITQDGKALVADSLLKKVLVFDNKGDFEGEFARGFAFQRPTAVAVSPVDGTVWVVDTLSHQAIKFSSSGDKLLAVGKRGVKHGEFNYPSGMAVAKDGRVFVCDTLNARVQIFSSAGKFISAFGKQGDSTGDFSHPKSVALDSDGNVYVVDGLFDAVQIFDEKGRLLLVFGLRGTREGEFYVPASISIDENDTIYVADSYNKRVQQFRYIKESQQ
jgi:DNA-binding beta-propeller fold protein YncE